MEIILKKDIQGLGYVNDVVSVKAGYGRNYLIPQGLAVVANESNKKIAAENIKQAAHKAEKLKSDAEALASKISGASVKVSAKIGDSGKIFGAVTTLQLADALNDNISERIEACEDLKKILKDAQDAQRNSYKQWRASD